MDIKNNKIRGDGIKWYTISEWYDRDTGEEISFTEIKNYIVINKTIDYEIKGKQGIKKITNECWRTEQLKLKL